MELFFHAVHNLMSFHLL